MDLFYSDLDGDAILDEVDLTSLQKPDNNSHTGSIVDHLLIETPLDIPSDFPDFPYSKPYPQQLDLMKAIYAAADAGRSGLFESPTGTGKSLSFLTASLRWLLDKNAQIRPRLKTLVDTLAHPISPCSSAEKDDWIFAFEQSRRMKQILQPEIERLSDICSCLDTINQVKSSVKVLDFTSPSEDANVPSQPVTSLVEPEDITDEFSTAHFEEELDASTDHENPNIMRIIYCSRTHSQLSQILAELQKCPSLKDVVTVVQLSSRHLLCTNKKVYSLSNPDAINDACLELAKSNSRCPIRNKQSVSRLSEFILSGHSALHIASSVRNHQYDDVFESSLAKNLRELSNDSVARHLGCPYYASRQSIPLAQLVLIPFPTLLQRNTRTSSGIHLRNSVVIIDEAHNLLEATTNCLSVCLELRDLKCVLAVLRAYQQQYCARFSSLVSLRLRQLIHFTSSLLTLLTRLTGTGGQVMNVNKFLTESGLDNISTHELVHCLHRPHFLRKLVGFANWLVKRKVEKVDMPIDNGAKRFNTILAGMKRKHERTEDSDNAPSLLKQDDTSSIRSADALSDLEGASGSLYKFQSFLESLVNPEDDARILVTPPQNNHHSNSSDDSPSRSPSLYFTILNPGHYLQEIIRESRCVLLTGGTMQPFGDLKDQIFPNSNDLVTFTCDHVIRPEHQLAVYPVAESDSGQTLDFTYQNRSSLGTMDACGEIIHEVCQCTPGGVVAFLPSYEYQRIIYSRWRSSGLLARIGGCKRVFLEPRNSSGLTKVMEAYTQACAGNESGALLICVIGGKLSEGINFSDNLARAVLIVGMPYPNAQCPLLQAKMLYLDKAFTTSSNTTTVSMGRRHYEALCMRAINQAIGRALRHANDYAVVFLLDKRFSRQSVQSQLPAWVLQALRHSLGQGRQSIKVHDAVKQARAFFERFS